MAERSEPFREGTVSSERHSSSYLEAGPHDGPAVVMLHGWPETSLAWRHQLTALGALGFRVIAPDMRGCGHSTIHSDHADYAQCEIVRDMIELIDGLEIARAVWIGHDWGSAVAWNIAAHHPDRCAAIASLCVPYRTLERGIDETSALLNRTQYPEAEFPAGQFEYIRFYHENFEAARKVFEGDPGATFKVIMRKGDPAVAGQRYPTAFVRKRGGWFGPGMPPPDVPLDESILSPDDLSAYVEAYRKTGFFGVNSLYMNDWKNRLYSDEAADGGQLSMPVLFLSGLYDYVSDTERSDLPRPMREHCADLTIQTLPTGHWMQHEEPALVNATICGWIARRVPDAWPRASKETSPENHVARPQAAAS